MDLNDDGDAQSYPNAFGPTTGRTPKANTQALAPMLESHHLVLANTLYPHAPKFLGSKWTSRIDHIALPHTTTPKIRQTYVDQRPGDKHQAIVPKDRTSTSLAKRDHRPLTINVDLTLRYQAPPPNTIPGIMRLRPTC